MVTPKNVENQIGSLLFTIFRVSRLLTKKKNQELTKNGLTLQFAQLPILRLVSSMPDSKLSQRDIARLLHKDKAGIQRSIHSLQRAGYLQIRPANSDKRKNIIQITPAGRMAADKAMSIFKTLEEDLIGQLDIEEIVTYIKICNKLIGSFSVINKTS